MSNHSPSGTRTDDSESLFSLEERLLREERRLADAVLRRTRIFAEIAARRKDGKRRDTGQDFEKTIWKVWEGVLQSEEAGHSRHWRQLVSQFNNLGQAFSEQKFSRKGNTWLLRPIAPAKAIALAGPADVFSTRIISFWAAVTNAPVQIRPAILNDGLIELIKSLNQTGAGLAWEKETVSHTPHRLPELSFEQKTIHAGQNTFTLALMVALAMARPGIAKFSGSGALNMFSIKPWQAVLPQLGARLHQLNPHAPGLPVRLESSGQPSQAQVDAETPMDLILALLAAAPFFPRGLELTWSDHPVTTPELETMFQLYSSFGVPFARLSRGIRVSAAMPRLPQQPCAPLDYFLSSMLLAWSRLTGQKMSLHGVWPEGPSAAHHLELLRSCGVQVEIQPDHIRTTPESWPESPVLDTLGREQALPLAVTLALCAPKGCTILGRSETLDLDVVQEMSLWTGRDCIPEQDSIRFVPSTQPADRGDGIFEAPDSRWAMALAMISFRFPGLRLTNPGELTALWPGFWDIHQSVLALSKQRTEEPSPRSSESHSNESSRTGKRRVKI
ncbi:3-phosphoshikimate 1-carboxyvinyltransferase [Desulfonatronum parangueonense]